MKDPVAKFDDPKVQSVYEILCNDEAPPKSEHWEGFIARRIVDALAQSANPQTPDDLLRQSEKEGWRWAKECEAEVKRLKELTKPKQAGALPPTTNAVYWMDMVVANLVRNGVNKHRAKELAHHFYTYTTPIGEQA